MRSFVPKVLAGVLLSSSLLASVASTASASVYAACTPTLRALTESVRSGGVPAGATVLGISDPHQTLALSAGSSTSGDIYLFNQASLQISGGPFELAGNVYLVDKSALHIVNADVTIPNSDSTHYKWLAGDDATVEITDSKLTVASKPGGIHRTVLCGRAHGIVQGTDFSRVKPSTEALFVWEAAALTLTRSQGGFEISADNAGQLDIHDQRTAADGHTLVYFAIHGALPAPLTFAGGKGISTTIQFPADALGQAMSASIRNADILFALRVDPGASINLVDSSVGLFLTSGGNASVSGMGPGHFVNQTFNMGDRSIGLVNTDVWVWNAYLDSPDGTLALSNAWLGELTCTSAAAGKCRAQNVVIDGSGGYLGAAGSADMLLDHSVILTYIIATDRSTVRLRSSALVPPDPSTGRLTPWINAAQTGLVVLENSVIDPRVAHTVTEQGAIAFASIDNPQDGANVSLGATLTIHGTAAIQSASPTGTNAFVSYALRAVPVAGGSAITIGQGRTPSIGGVLGTFATSGLSRGQYELHLSLVGRSGQIADAVRTVTLS